MAERIARGLLEDRLVACANIVPGLRSLYWWRDEIQTDDEVLMLLKARSGDVDAIAARAVELHPYEVPEVIATPVISGLGAYLEWVHDETERSNPGSG